MTATNNHRATPVSDSVKAGLKYFYEKGYSIPMLTERYKLSNHVIHRTLITLGVVLRNHREARMASEAMNRATGVAKHLPTPEEIEQAIAEIQASWDEEERAIRSGEVVLPVTIYQETITKRRNGHAL